MQKNDWKMSPNANKTPFMFCGKRCETRKCHKRRKRTMSCSQTKERKWDLHYSVYTTVHSLANCLTSTRHTTHSHTHTQSIPLNYLHFSRLVLLHSIAGAHSFGIFSCKFTTRSTIVSDVGILLEKNARVLIAYWITMMSTRRFGVVVVLIVDTMYARSFVCCRRTKKEIKFSYAKRLDAFVSQFTIFPIEI